MSKKVTTLRKGMPLKSAIKLVTNTLHCGFPVVDKNNKVIGIITKSDIDDAFIENQLENTPVDKFMNPNPVLIEEDKPLFDALLDLHLNNVNWLIVTDDKNSLKGIITRYDIKLAFKSSKNDSTKEMLLSKT
ncbi:MAG: CBS domain-containing protein [Candidatus Gastranaerophilales bacterium]|nr:CBS domain-containing protein [Candidatus Gastranaerophilales bacterium]